MSTHYILKEKLDEIHKSANVFSKINVSSAYKYALMVVSLSLHHHYFTPRLSRLYVQGTRKTNRPNVFALYPAGLMSWYSVLFQDYIHNKVMSPTEMPSFAPEDTL